MQLRYLEYFVQAVECKSLNRAARKLDVSPQALCAGVAALEKKLGYALLERSPMGVRPTKNGEIVFQDARDMRDVFHKWFQLSHRQPEKDTVMVKLGASTTLMRWLVPQVVLHVKRLYPHIYFNLYESFVEQVFHTVVDQRMLGLITCVNERVESTYRVRLAQNDMTFMEGPEDGCAVIINKSHPFANLHTLTLRDLSALRLAFNPQRDQYFVYRDICKHFSPSGIIHIPEQENLLRLISMDVSTAAVLPRRVLLAPGGWAQKVCAMDVADFPMPGRIWFIYPEDMRSSEKLVQESIAELLDLLKKEEAAS
ncbi:LysR family transcriptional regulator [Mailhella massiliensis]|uniref:LysR family transcriptional regulator n=1 Tax=Mailhella massiliensis TaxID=1903261 RepID=A0A921AWY8_9BACT|nr:LysR family transcriptional regulator [Mailhella massiliensis]HJD97644.1 LysR family transcriptional regulator [Mailhella massiliensis]